MISSKDNPFWLMLLIVILHSMNRDQLHLKFVFVPYTN